jgi:hypothetical protein
VSRVAQSVHWLASIARSSSPWSDTVLTGLPGSNMQNAGHITENNDNSKYAPTGKVCTQARRWGEITEQCY